MCEILRKDTKIFRDTQMFNQNLFAQSYKRAFLFCETSFRMEFAVFNIYTVQMFCIFISNKTYNILIIMLLYCVICLVFTDNR